MCLKNKIVAAGFCALIAGIGIFGISNNTANATATGTASTGYATLGIEQLQKIVESLIQQIQQLRQMIAELKPLETCGNGKCRFGETAANCAADCGATNCANECTGSGERKCEGAGFFQTCGNYDTDSCLEWSSLNSCPSGQTCSGGKCASKVAVCGNYYCETGETTTSCPADCKAAGCIAIWQPCTPATTLNSSGTTVLTNEELAAQIAAVQAQLQNTSNSDQIGLLQSQLQALLNQKSATQQCCNGLTCRIGNNSTSGICVEQILNAVCGNGACETGETLSSCAADCNTNICGKSYGHDPSNSEEGAKCANSGGEIDCSGRSGCYCKCGATCKANYGQKTCLLYQVGKSPQTIGPSNACNINQQTFSGCDFYCQPIISCQTNAAISVVPFGTVVTSTPATSAAYASMSVVFTLKITATGGDIYMPSLNAFTVRAIKDNDTNSANWTEVQSVYVKPNGTTQASYSLKIPQNTTVVYTITSNYSLTGNPGNYNLRITEISWSPNDGAWSPYKPNPAIFSESKYLQNYSASVCGNSVCENGENTLNCSQDCKTQNDSCITFSCIGAPAVSPIENNISATLCNGVEKNRITCPETLLSGLGMAIGSNYRLCCDSVCGDDICETGETGLSCPADCK